MIASGEKKEEYREIKPYWFNRFFFRDEFIGLDGHCFREFDLVRFKNGYSSTAPTVTVEFKGIECGYGREDWGGSKDEVFVIKLGEIITP